MTGGALQSPRLADAVNLPHMRRIAIQFFRGVPMRPRNLFHRNPAESWIGPCHEQNRASVVFLDLSHELGGVFAEVGDRSFRNVFR